MLYAVRLISTLSLIYFICFSVAYAQNTINVLGTANVSVVPDKLTFKVSFREKGLTVSKLYAKVQQSTGIVIRHLMKEGVDEESIQSMAIQVQPIFEYEGQRKMQKGFEIIRTISVTLNNIDGIGTLLDHLFRVGNTEISNVRLWIANEDEHYQYALTLALASARKKAELMAKNLAVKVGGAVSVVELPPFSHTRQASDIMVQRDDMPNEFLPGQVRINARVEVHFSIE